MPGDLSTSMWVFTDNSTFPQYYYEELGCPGNYRWEIIAQWAKFQGNLPKRQSGVFYTNNGAHHHYSHSGAIISVYHTKYIGKNLQTCKNFRGIFQTLKSCACVFKTYSYLHYSHSGAIIRVSYIPTLINTMCTWKSFRGGNFQSKILNMQHIKVWSVFFGVSQDVLWCTIWWNIMNPCYLYARHHYINIY